MCTMTDSLFWLAVKSHGASLVWHSSTRFWKHLNTLRAGYSRKRIEPNGKEGRETKTCSEAVALGDCYKLEVRQNDSEFVEE